MGARPVALLNSLRFGPLDDARNCYLCAGVVRGVGDYGNCVGVPTLGGEVDFATGYSGNPLVNAMCVGVLREKDLIKAAAHGVGNVLLAVGSSTGRDGIHGASFASEELTHESERRRPQVQVGDPFTEKLLLEASLELIASGLIVAIQDMGAAGLTSSSAEMAAKGGAGVELDLSLVPTREPGMTPYEILLSESQERMLIVARPDRLAAIQAVAAKWELNATAIGRVTDDGMYRAKWRDQVVVEIPGRRLIDDCPVYHPQAAEDPRVAELRRQGPHPASPSPHPADVLLKLLDQPPVASKRWVYEQYDSAVQAGTVLGPGGDAGVIRVRVGGAGAAFGIAVTVDCNSRYVLLDPYEGGKAAVAEAARNIACTGARPLGVTDCLNFGSPERPAVFHQFTQACRGIADACRALDTPVTGGNVSFYNENPAGAVDPTPVVGMVGLLARADRAVPSHARARGDVVFVLGETRAELGASQLWDALYGFVGGGPPRVDLAAERRLVDYLGTAAERGLLRSAHDCSQGGLGVALAEVAMGDAYAETGFGLDVDLTSHAIRSAVFGVARPRRRDVPARARHGGGGAGAGVGRASAARRGGGRAGRRGTRTAARRRARAPRRAVARGIFRQHTSAHGRLSHECAASSASPAFPTRPASPTSGSTACSTAGKSRRGSWPWTARVSRDRTAGWGSSRTSSTRRCCTSCRATWRSAIRATRPPAPPSSPTPSRCSPDTAKAPWPSRTTVTSPTPSHSGPTW